MAKFADFRDYVATSATDCDVGGQNLANFAQGALDTYNAANPGENTGGGGDGGCDGVDCAVGQCTTAQATYLDDLAGEVGGKYPHLGCLDVLRGASAGATFGDTGAENELSEVELCRCLGGMQMIDEGYTAKINEQLDCIVHEAHEDVTIPLAASGCLAGIKAQLEECPLADVTQVGLMATQVQSEYPQFGCGAVVASALGGNSFPPCTDAEEGQLCDRDLCLCLGGGMTAVPAFADKLYAMECWMFSEDHLPMTVLASKCLDAYNIETGVIAPPTTDSSAPLCADEVISQIGAMANAADLSHPELNCMAVYTAAASGHTFGEPGTVDGLDNFDLCPVRVFRQKFTLEDAIGSHACSLEALTCV
jgi:hypothetical protein